MTFASSALRTTLLASLVLSHDGQGRGRQAGVRRRAAHRAHLAYAIGEAQWKATDMVADEVLIKFHVVAGQ